MEKNKKHALVIVGAGEFGHIAYEYFTHDSDYEVVGFAAEAAFRKEDTFLNLPCIDLETLRERFPKDTHHVFVAVTNTQLNRVRRRLFRQVRDWGYHCASYISSHAFVWHTAKIGVNCFIFEQNVIQHGVTIGDNCILWSGNHVGHQTQIDQDVFIASHAVISGYCKIGSGCFVGVNSTFADNVQVAPDCYIAAAALITKSTEQAGIYQGHPATKRDGINTYRFCKVPVDEQN